MESLHKTHIFGLVKSPKDKKVLKNKCLYRLKQEHNPHSWYKAKFFLKGIKQTRNFDFDETLSLVMKMPSICMIFGLTASLDLKIKQINVKTTSFIIIWRKRFT